VLALGQIRGLGAEGDLGDRPRAAAAAVEGGAQGGAAGGEGGAAEQELSAGEPQTGFQWKVKETRWGLSQTSRYSTCLADTGGLMSRLSS